MRKSHYSECLPAGCALFFGFFDDFYKARGSTILRNARLDASATRYLASGKMEGINMVGTDSPSIDLGVDGSFSTHHILAENNILFVENLANLDRIQSKEFHFAVMLLKLCNAIRSSVQTLGFDPDQW